MYIYIKVLKHTLTVYVILLVHMQLDHYRYAVYVVHFLAWKLIVGIFPLTLSFRFIKQCFKMQFYSMFVKHNQQSGMSS